MPQPRTIAPVLQSILTANAGRKPKLVSLKLQRMNQDAFSFFRGTNHLLAQYWPDLKPPDLGPHLLQCGDLHLENFGAYQTDDGTFLYDINDFDEALVAPCCLDLVRCTASILVAAECWRLTPLAALGMALVFLDRYRETVTSHSLRKDDVPQMGRGPIWELLGETAQTSQTALLNRNTTIVKGKKREIIVSKTKHPPVGPNRAKRIREALKGYAATRPDPKAYKVLDITGRIAGTGSLGARRYLVLIDGGKTPETNRLLDIKEEFPPSLEACAGSAQPDFGAHEADRVVDAQRTLQAKPAAGLGVLSIDGKSYRIRELIPDDNRTSLSRFLKQPDKLRQAIEEAGQLAGCSHLRGIQHRRKGDRTNELVKWAASSSLDAVLVAAARYAERTRVDFEEYQTALADPKNLPSALRPRPAAKSGK